MKVSKSQWISVKDKLPKCNQRVLVVIQHKQKVTQTYVSVSTFSEFTDCFGNKRIFKRKIIKFPEIKNYNQIFNTEFKL